MLRSMLCVLALLSLGCLSGTRSFAGSSPPADRSQRSGILARLGLNSARIYRPGVRQLVFTADGRTLVSDGGNGVQLWEARTGKLRARLRGANVLLSVAADGKTLSTRPPREG